VSECQHCAAEVADAFLCGRCRTDLHDNLAELPWWLARLTETALGHTRMADTGGRKSAARRDLDGDAELASCIEALPDCDDLDKARAARQRAAMAHALATGGINARASELLAEIADTLAYWCRVLCEERGIDYRPARSAEALGANHARWLARHVESIAAASDAGDIADDILGRDKHRRGLIDQIEHAINRRWRWWPLGECPTPVRVEGPAQHGRPHPHRRLRCRAACPGRRRGDPLPRVPYPAQGSPSALGAQVPGRSRAHDGQATHPLQPRPATRISSPTTHTAALAGHRKAVRVRRTRRRPALLVDRRAAADAAQTADGHHWCGGEDPMRPPIAIELEDSGKVWCRWGVIEHSCPRPDRGQVGPLMIVTPDYLRELIDNGPREWPHGTHSVTTDGRRVFAHHDYHGQRWTWELFPAYFTDNLGPPICIGRWPD
jgi:hypothetical protein